MNTTIDTTHDDINGSLADDWENYKAYTRFYHITDEVFLYANPILILIGKFIIILFKNKNMYSRYSNACIIYDNISS